MARSDGAAASARGAPRGDGGAKRRRLSCPLSQPSLPLAGRGAWAASAADRDRAPVARGRAAGWHVLALTRQPRPARSAGARGDLPGPRPRTTRAVSAAAHAPQPPHQPDRAPDGSDRPRRGTGDARTAVGAREQPSRDPDRSWWHGQDPARARGCSGGARAVSRRRFLRRCSPLPVRAGRAGHRRRARCARDRGRAAAGDPHPVPAAAPPPPAARQLRAGAGKRARHRHAAGRLPTARRPGHQPGATAHPGRARDHRGAAAPRRAGTAAATGRVSGGGCGGAVHRACAGRKRRLRAHSRQRGRRGRHLSAPRRLAASYRAGRRPGQGAPAGGAAGPARATSALAHRWQP